MKLGALRSPNDVGPQGNILQTPSAKFVALYQQFYSYFARCPIAAPAGSLTWNVTCAHNDGPYTGDITKTQGSCATTVASIQGTAVGIPTGTASSAVVLATTPTITTPVVVGQVGGNAVGTGDIGEYLSQSVADSVVSLTTTDAIDVATLTISAGYWLCSGNVTVATGTTGWSNFKVGVSTTVNTLPTPPAGGAFAQVVAAAGVVAASSLNTGSFLENVSVSTTLHLVTALTFANTATGGGFIGCMRMN